jgi:uncharacterized membrane protein (DUF4010 family)
MERNGFGTMMLENLQLSYPMRFGIALALGLLIGLERESAELRRQTRFRAGVRTYAILSLFGFACAWLSTLHVEFALPAGMLTVGALITLEYSAKIAKDRLGWTSEIAALLTFATGALSLLADIWVPLALGIVNLMLLTEKTELESYVERLDKAEFLAVTKFLLVTVIILPILPDQEYTQFKLNPVHTWRIVIMVSSIGFVGYFLSKKFGEKQGLWFSGILGGVVSSTAVSIAVGRIAQNNPDQSGNALQASLLASSVMYLRILILVLIINPIFASHLVWKLPLLALIGALFSVGTTSPVAAGERNSVPPPRNPFEIRPALLFAAAFTILSVVTKLVTNAFGDSGLLVLSALVGVTDIDPYILSLIRHPTNVEPVVIAGVLIATMSNTIIKGIYFAVLSKPVRRQAIFRYFAWALLHIPLIVGLYL